MRSLFYSGQRMSIFRAIFAGLEFPIKDRNDLIDKAGGKERIVIVTEPAGGEVAYSLLDLLDAFPELNKLFPMESVKDVVKKFAVIEVRRRRERKISPLPKIGGKHMAKLSRECPLPIHEPELKI